MLLNTNHCRVVAPVKKNGFKKLLIRTIIFLCAWQVNNAIAVGSEYKLKAAYLYQFTKFTQWPESKFEDANTPIKICVLGHNPFGSLLDNFSNRSSQQRSISIKLIKNLKALPDCHIVYIDKSEKKRLQNILKKIKNMPVLSVSDITGFAQKGGIIGFIPKHKKLGIEVNIKASKIAKTKLSSKLIEISSVVDSEMPGGKL